MKWLGATLLVTLTACAFASEPQPLPESSQSTLGYKTAAEALESLRARSDVQEQEQRGWLVFADMANHTLWSFPPKEHPAYPSAVKREIVERSGTLYMNMSVLCEASKKACDQLVRDFQELNEQMRRAAQAGSGQEQ